MSASALSSRAIIGSFYRRLKQNSGLKWVEAISNYFQSDQDSETYNWLGQVPVMREWAGGRQAKGFTTNGLTIENKHFEATLEVPVKDLRRDKTGQTRIRINELADRTNSHWAQLLSKLIVSGESTVCYDGQYFFDTDHEEGKSGQQSNKITYTAETGETSLKEDLFRRAMLKARNGCPAAAIVTDTAVPRTKQPSVVISAMSSMRKLKNSAIGTSAYRNPSSRAVCKI